jgi:hypothetical protein
MRNRGDARSGLGELERNSSLTSVDLQVRVVGEGEREREKIKKMKRKEKI